MGRITLDGGISQFSTGLETAPELWNAKAGQSNGKTLHELKVNRELKELEEATAEIEKNIGITHTIATHRSYVNAYMNLSRFIKEKYKKEDIPFSQLEYSFIEDYDLYLKMEQRMAKGSVVQHIIFLRKMIKRAMHKGIITRNPFFGYVPDQPVSKHKWLSYAKRTGAKIEEDMQLLSEKIKDDYRLSNS
ncbi:MAG: phage integrase SAM-like domain-containing protein [Tannerellaceae bacterium]|jgi:hypothetical protein|nr:phage integrase SAM-like domain-containing protein [Tannerellaceae bacterium]